MTRSKDPQGQDWAEAAGQCVLCGMCSRVCPTYHLYKEEGESPRGRVVMMQALLAGETVGERWREHLDHCLGCRACEAVCPSGVAYGPLLDGVRARFAPSAPTWVDRFAAGVRWWRRLGPLLRLGRRLHALPALPGVGRPPLLPPQGRWARRYPAQGPFRGEVTLFLGCVASLWDRDTLVATVRLLRLAGYAVRVPPSQGCCGALAWHEGREGEGRRLAERLLEALTGEGPVVTAATGCSAHLREYGAVLGEAGAAFANRVCEAGSLIDIESLPVRWRDAPLRVALHVPCSQAFVWRQPALYRRLLEALPGVEVVTWEAGLSCCGAGGGRLLHEPEQAERLRERWVAALRKLQVDVAVTSNVGCRLHLAPGLERMDIRLLHPLALIEQRIDEVES